MLICANCGAYLEPEDLDFDEHDIPRYCPECGHTEFGYEAEFKDDSSYKNAERRKSDWTKAIRKRNIIRRYGFDYYDNLHQYSKNKIHCSCPICREKTNGHKQLSVGSNQYTIMDRRRIDEMENQKVEFETLERT